MDLSSPISSVIPSAHGAVLTVLARSDVPMSGRQVAVLVDGRVSQVRVNQVLGELADAGIVTRESHPPAKLYRLNVEHVAATGIIALVHQREELLERIRTEVCRWEPAAASVVIFGSAARGDGSPSSDIDLLVVRRDAIPADEAAWTTQIDQLSERVSLWTGNHCEVLELAMSEVAALVAAGERLVDELRSDSVDLGGTSVRSLLRSRQAQVAR